MENSSHKSAHGGAVKEEHKASESNADEASCWDDIDLQVRGGRRRTTDDGVKPASPNQKGSNCSLQQELTLTKMERASPVSESRSSSSAKKEQQDDELESAKAEMDQVMEENQRLKMYLNKILKGYQALQIQYKDVIQQEAKKSPQTLPAHHDDSEEEHELIALSLGRSSSETGKDEAPKLTIREKMSECDKEGLTLRLDCRFKEPISLPNEPSPNPSPENSVEEVKEEAADTWPPKTMKNNVRDGGDDEISQQNPAKRARVSVRVRCDTPTMNDGCQWRKYGQKIAKGNPCPRAYYRCTVAPSCPVRKQVQRCADDMTILITTYEGTHNHPLPVSATAMASTTSAAAAMLMSGSSTSGSGPGSSSMATTTTTSLNALNFYLSDNLRSKTFYVPTSSFPSSHSHPTITLDLTSSSSSSSSHLNRIANFPPRYPTTNLNFSSSETNLLPISWSNGMLSYGTQPFNKNQTLNFGSQAHETQLYQSYLQKNIINPNPNQQSLAPDTIAAATKAITSDPSFHTALAAALTSIVGNQNAAEKSSQGTKSSESYPILSSYPSTSNANKCAPNLLSNSSPSTSSQPGGLMFLSPFSSSKTKSNSSCTDRDNVS